MFYVLLVACLMASSVFSLDAERNNAEATLEKLTEEEFRKLGKLSRAEFIRVLSSKSPQKLLNQSNFDTRPAILKPPQVDDEQRNNMENSDS